MNFFIREKASFIWIRLLCDTTKHEPILMFAEGLGKYCDTILENHNGNLLNIDWKTIFVLKFLYKWNREFMYCFDLIHFKGKFKRA